MIARYLLDTNILSEPLALHPDPAVMSRLKRHGKEIATASIVWHELLFGARRIPASRRRSAIERYLHQVVEANLDILPYDAAAADWHGRERARLEGEGTVTSFADGQIAAIAAVNRLVLVTRKAKDFQPFQGIRVENWFSP